MQLWQFIWMLAALTGLAAAGIVGNGWAIATGRRPDPRMLSAYSVSTPLRVLALIIYAPLALVRTGIAYLEYNPVFALMVLATGLVWSFLQGVFILTTFFGYT